MSFSQLPATQKKTENAAAVTSLRLFLFCQGFKHCQVAKKYPCLVGIELRTVASQLLPTQPNLEKICTLNVLINEIMGF